MTRQDHILKWLIYGLALLPVLALGLYVLPWFPIRGVIPMLLPVAAITVAVLEGPTAGAGFGLFVGALSDALIPGTPGAMTLGLSALGFAAGALAWYRVSQNLWGCLLCSAGGLALIDLTRVAGALLRGKAPLLDLLKIAGREVFWSLVFLPLIYAIFRWVSRRVPQPTVL